ncbi:MAG: DUF4097 family beta strand repeat-containing protein, partial [Gemmatimonadaceae bacterium]
MRTASVLTASLLLLSVTAISSPMGAQRRERDDSRWLDKCSDDGWGDRGERFCEVRDVPLSGTPSRLHVDGGENGGVTVIGWDQSTVRVRARIEAHAPSESEARSLARDVRISTDGTIRAEGPDRGRRSRWSVSYIIYAPRRMDLDLETSNGGIGIEDVEGSMRLRATNGGISLDGTAGDVRAETKNGGIHVNLDGSRWRGTGLDARTSNGGVEVFVPKGYSAQLETGTVNGGFTTDFPITVQGRLTHRLSITLGNGGSPVRAVTTN